MCDGVRGGKSTAPGFKISMSLRAACLTASGLLLPCFKLCRIWFTFSPAATKFVLKGHPTGAPALYPVGRLHHFAVGLPSFYPPSSASAILLHYLTPPLSNSLPPSLTLNTLGVDDRCNHHSMRELYWLTISISCYKHHSCRSKRS